METSKEGTSGHLHLHMGKNFVSDGHFCKSFCPASHKKSISGDFRHCCRVMIYLDCVMSNNYDLLQNKSLRNRLIIAASVMEFISTTPKNELFEIFLLQNQPKTTNFINWWTYKYQFPVFSSVFQSKCSFGFPVTAFIKKYAFVHHWRRPCPSLTQKIDDKKQGIYSAQN